MKVKNYYICLIALFAIMLTGCSLSSAEKLTFVQTPQAIYYVVGSDEALAAQEEVLENVIVKVDGVPYTLKDLKNHLGAEVLGLDLTKEGTHTLIVKYGGATLTYIYKVVTNLADTLFGGGSGVPGDEYIISTPQHFVNMMTRVYGVPAPVKSTAETNANEEAWKNYYQASFPFFTTGLHFKIISDLNFSGFNYKTLGALGGDNFIPFTGKIDGNGKTIRNLKIESVGAYTGLFAGLLSATISNLNFDNVEVPMGMGKYTAILSATSLPLIDWDVEAGEGTYDLDNQNKIENIKILNSFVAGFDRVGGLLVRMSHTDIKDVEVDSNTTIVGVSQTAGVVGHLINTSKYSYIFLKDRYGPGTNTTGKNTTNAISNTSCDATVVSAENSQLANDQLIYYSSTVGKDSEIVVYQPNSSNGIFKFKYEPDNNYSLLYSWKTSYATIPGVSTGTSERVFILGSNAEVLNTSKGKIRPYYETVSSEASVETKDTAVEGHEDKAYYFDSESKTLYVNNRYYLYDIDGNATEAFYPITGTSYNSIYKVFVNNDKIVSIIKVALS